MLFVVGYFGGSRYAVNPLAGIDAVVLDKPVVIASPMGVQLDERWQLLLVGDLSEDSCRRQLDRMTRIHNRLAHRADLTDRLSLIAVSILDADTHYRSNGQVVHWQIQTTDHAGLANLASQLGISNTATPKCHNQPLALIDPTGHLRALIPASMEPQAAAMDLERLIDQLMN